MGVLSIDYETLILVVILLFAGVGFTRGWLKEGVTTVLLVFLVGLLYKPELVSPIVGFLNTLMQAFQLIVSDGATPAAGNPGIFVPENPYNFLMWLLIILIALSYIGTRYAIQDRDLSPLSRILGGLAGAINGFIAISLFKEYLLGYFEGMTSGQASVAALQGASPPPDGVALAFQNVPQQPFVESVGPFLAVLAGMVIALFILSSIFKWNVK